MIKISVRIAERFAFVTGEEINLPVNKAVPENTKKYLQTLLAFLTVFLFFETKFKYTSSLRIGVSYKFHSVQQSFNEIVTKERR